jgi:hypothetical protein
MRIEGAVLPIQFRSFGIGIDLVVDNCLWAFYPVDLSCKGKYIGYAICPKGVSYHVLRNLYLDKKVHLWLRKIRKDRNNG